MKGLTQSSQRRVTPGDLTELVSIYAETRTPDGYAGATTLWTEQSQAWAEVTPLFVGEREIAGAVRDVTQYRFTLYRDLTVTQQHVILWNGQPYGIRGLRLGGAREMFMDIVADAADIPGWNEIAVTVPLTNILDRFGDPILDRFGDPIQGR